MRYVTDRRLHHLSRPGRVSQSGTHVATCCSAAKPQTTGPIGLELAVFGALTPQSHRLVAQRQVKDAIVASDKQTVLAVVADEPVEEECIATKRDRYRSTRLSCMRIMHQIALIGSEDSRHDPNAGSFGIGDERSFCTEIVVAWRKQLRQSTPHPWDEKVKAFRLDGVGANRQRDTALDVHKAALAAGKRKDSVCHGEPYIVGQICVDPTHWVKTA